MRTEMVGRRALTKMNTTEIPMIKPLINGAHRLMLG